MDRDIKVVVADRVATTVGDPEIICGNSDYTITFAFDDEWAGVEAKTAVFKYLTADGMERQEQPFLGDVVEVPILTNTREVEVGVYAGNLTTTTGAPIRCLPCIRCGAGEKVEPSPDKYDELMELINLIKQDISAIPKFGVSVVDELPTENINSTTIYLTPREGESANGYPEHYDEFLYVNGAWELLGCVSTNSDFEWVTPDLPNPPLAGDSNPSVSVKVEEIEGGHRVSITTASGTQSFDVLDGAKGEKGDKGDPYTLTDADKNIIVNAVLEALPKYNGEVVEV